MNRTQETIQALLRSKIVAVLRLKRSTAIADVTAALLEGGIRCIEVTMTTPNAIECIEYLAQTPGIVAVGAGTVLTLEQTLQSMQAGATFIVSPVIVEQSIKAAVENDIAAIPGAMTPTEIYTAMLLGACMVKVFPATALGPSFISAIKAPLLDVLLMPTGGITADSAPSYLKAGASVLCAGSWLVSDSDVERGRFADIERKARQLVTAVADVPSFETKRM